MPRSQAPGLESDVYTNRFLRRLCRTGIQATKILVETETVCKKYDAVFLEMDMKLAVQLVTWNGARYIPPLFESLKKNWEEHTDSLDQTKKMTPDWMLYILDNGSQDDTVSTLKQELKKFSFLYGWRQENTNTGFAGGHNRLFAMNKAEYTLIINQDLVFERDCIDQLVNFLNRHPEAGAVAPRLMSLFEHDTIDSLGLKKYRNGRVVDVGAGKHLNTRGHKHSSTEVFGVSGACAMFRRSALSAVAFADGAIFDESYGSYKEDVDLAYRLSRTTYRSFVLLDAVAYHARGSGRGKKNQPFSIRYQSYRNHLATLYKNFSFQSGLIDFPLILCYESVKLAWYFVFDHKVLKAWKELWLHRGELKAKRRWIQKISKYERY